jgi:hypothetical protein
MKYWLDTEFIAHPFTIDLVSIGVVAENGREFYAESNEVDWSRRIQLVDRPASPTPCGSSQSRVRGLER